VKAFAVMGGTFDPVHNGHLQIAREAGEQLGLEKVILIPSREPPHRSAPERSPKQRLAMLKLAVQGLTTLEVDDRELHRSGPSFTVDTLASLRQEAGPDTSISMLLGLDAFTLLPSWHRWEEVRALVNVVVLDRPGPNHLSQLLNDLIVERHQRPEDLVNVPCGKVTRIRTTQLNVSSTLVREALAAGRAVDNLLPVAVLDYIRRHQLYE